MPFPCMKNVTNPRVREPALSYFPYHLLFKQPFSATHHILNLHTHRPSNTPPSPNMASTSTAQQISRPHASPFFTQLLHDKFDRKIDVHPTKLNTFLSLLHLREEGVISVMQNIRDCGWTGSPLYASDRGGNQLPVLLEGGHRIEALRRLLARNETSWLLRGQTPENFKVQITVFKNLSSEEESRIRREFNNINSKNVRMTLLDQIVAMHKALTLCRRRKNIPENAPVNLQLLIDIYPDYGRYHRSTVRAWRRAADQFGPESIAYLLKTYSQGLQRGRLEVAFSKKTIQESKMLKTLQDYPGVQFWYLKRLVYMEAHNKIKYYNASHFNRMAVVLKHFADALNQFASCLLDVFKLHKLAISLQNLVKKGRAYSIQCKKEDMRQYRILSTFSNYYLWSTKGDKELNAAVRQRQKDNSLFPYILYQLVARIQFNNNFVEAEALFQTQAAKLRPRFTTPFHSKWVYKNHFEISRKRSHHYLQPSGSTTPIGEGDSAQKIKRNRSLSSRKSTRLDERREEQDEAYHTDEEEHEEEDESEDEEEEETEEEEEIDKKDESEEGEFLPIPAVLDYAEQAQDGVRPLTPSQTRMVESHTKEIPPTIEQTKTVEKKTSATKKSTATREIHSSSFHQSKPAVSMLEKSTLQLEIVCPQSSTLPSDILKGMKQLLPDLQYSPREVVQLLIHQQGKKTSFSFPEKENVLF